MELSIKDHRRDRVGLEYVYPVLSRRAGGVSVGINLNPNNACNWHCAYCQVEGLVRGSAPRIDFEQLDAELRGFLEQIRSGAFARAVGLIPEQAEIKDIAFSGNGEPTSAAEFPAVVERVGRIRADFGLDAVPLRLITNGSLLHRAAVRDGIAALGRLAGEVWFKVDAATSEDSLRINGVRLDPAHVLRDLRRCCELCPTWVQTCMFRWDGAAPSKAAIDAYVTLVTGVGPGLLRGVHLYGVSRPSCQAEAVHVAPLDAAELDAIAARLKEKGLTVRVSP